jgi:hypothetical protein
MCVLLLAVTAGPARGATTALYLFDTQTAEVRSFAQGQTTSDVWPDASGHGLDFVRRLTNMKGRVWRHPDTPPVITTGTSLEEWGGNPVEAPISGNYSFGATGQKTVEFWYKPLENDTVRFILSQDDVGLASGDGWGIYQLPPEAGGKFGIRFTQASSFIVPGATLDTPAVFQLNRWYHVAVTADIDSRMVTIYQDGNPVASGSILNFLVGPKDDAPLVLGTDSSPNRGFAGHFLIDELRFSDAVLLPGNGTGINELAWNASLAALNPEPATALSLLATCGLVGRRLRRRQDRHAG